MSGAVWSISMSLLTVLSFASVVIFKDGKLGIWCMLFAILICLLRIVNFLEKLI